MRFDNHDVPWVKTLVLGALVLVPAQRFLAEQPASQVKASTTQSQPAATSVQRAVEPPPASNQTFPAITG